MDNILIKTESREQYGEHVKGVFDKKKKKKAVNVNFSKSKIKYLGQMIDAKGKKADPSRSKVMKNMPASINMSALQAFLGLANYNGNFISNKQASKAPLNKLFKKDSKWNWSTEYQSAFFEIKKYSRQT